jgi:hypothetical protein
MSTIGLLNLSEIHQIFMVPARHFELKYGSAANYIPLLLHAVS